MSMYMALENKRPLVCQHKYPIITLTALGKGRHAEFGPPITIPAQSGLAQAKSNLASSVSSVTLENL